jgi:hypothetical protein
MDWISQVQDRDRWQVLVSTVMNFGFHKMRGISSVTLDMLASHKVLCFMELVKRVLILQNFCFQQLTLVF